MDVTHLTINVVMALSIIVGAIVMGIRLGELQSMIKEMRESLVDVKKIPLLEQGVAQVKETVSKYASDHRALERRVAKMQGENTGRWRLPPEPNGEDP